MFSVFEVLLAGAVASLPLVADLLSALLFSVLVSAATDVVVCVCAGAVVLTVLSSVFVASDGVADADTAALLTSFFPQPTSETADIEITAARAKMNNLFFIAKILSE